MRNKKNPCKHNYELMTYEMWPRCSRGRWRMGPMGRVFYKARYVLCSCWPPKCLARIPIVPAAAAPLHCRSSPRPNFPFLMHNESIFCLANIWIYTGNIYLYGASYVVAWSFWPIEPLVESTESLPYRNKVIFDEQWGNFWLSHSGQEWLNWHIAEPLCSEKRGSVNRVFSFDRATHEETS